jgi:telomere length regulation protein
MQDTYEMEQFQEMRQGTLIALVASAPEIVVGYLINLFFTGDISIQQRCILLSAIGIGARELAGLEKLVPTFFRGWLRLGNDSTKVITSWVA